MRPAIDICYRLCLLPQATVFYESFRNEERKNTQEGIILEARIRLFGGEHDGSEWKIGLYDMLDIDMLRWASYAA